jgi:hypothetical protein
MSSPWTLYFATTIGITTASRLWVKFRRDRKVRKSYQTPLFDDALLATICMPRHKDGDNADVLAEIYQTLSHLNRQHYAEELWGLDAQLAKYYAGLPEQYRPTMRRALVRMLDFDDRWLASLAARTCATLSLREAIEPLRTRLSAHNAITETGEHAAAGDRDLGSERFYQEIERSLGKLDTAPDKV